MAIDFTAIFKTQLDAHIKTVTQAVLDLETTGADLKAGSELIETLMREFHTIKGAARAVEFMEIKNCAHRLEDIYHQLMQGEATARVRELANITLYAIDLIGDMLDTRINDKPLLDNEVFDQLVDDYLAGKKVEVPQKSLATPSATHKEPSADGTEKKQSSTKDTEDKNFSSANKKPSEKTKKSTKKPKEKTVTTGDKKSQTPTIQEENTSQYELKPAPTTKAQTSTDYDRLTDTLLNLAGEFSVAIGGVDEQWNNLRRMRATVNAITQSTGLLLNSMADKITNLGGEAPQQRISDLMMRLKSISTEQRDISEHLEQTEGRLRYLGDELDEEVTHARLVTLETLFGSYPRVVRDLAAELGKEAKIDINGTHIRIDRSMLEAIRAPLIHVLRNCLDHGLEPPEEREALSKARHGQLRLSAVQMGGMVKISLSDDGRGINMAQVRDKVLARGDTDLETWDGMNLHEQEQFLFLPGFSTANTITDMSGRGFGLDIVKTELERVGGFVQVANKPGQGCEFLFELPVTLSLMNCLLVRGGQDKFFGAQNFCFPLNDVDEIHRPVQADIRELDGGLAIRLGEHTLPLHDFSHMMGIAGSSKSLEEKHLLIFEHGEQRHALLVDEVLDEMSAVTRNFEERLGCVRDMQAVTLLQNGEIALIVDVEDLLTRMNEGSTQHSNTASLELLATESNKLHDKRILVVEDSVTVREVERHMLETAGYSVETAVDGADGLNKIRSENFDLVITDIDMPRMNGIDMITKVRSIEKYVNMPIIVVSYKDREEDRNKALSVGANQYVTKAAFDSSDMLEIIEELTTLQGMKTQE